MDTCIYMVELLCCPPEITTTLLIGYTIFYFYKMKSFKKGEGMDRWGAEDR